MAIAPLEWRRIWRRRGLAVDWTMPKLFCIPAPPLEDLLSLVPKEVVLPGGDKQAVTEDDAASISDCLRFTGSFIAEFLPAQITSTDFKKPREASQLAVRRQGSQEQEYLGSFDMLLRIFQTRSGVWRQYHEKEIALDVKVTGYDAILGLNGPTMRAYIEHGRCVLIAARSAKTRLGDCSAIAYLVRRPPGFSAAGAPVRAGFGFVAFDSDTLASWDPSSQRAPPHITLAGNLLQAGRVLEPDNLPPASLPSRPRQRDRWAELAALEVKRGWVTLLDFTTVFEQGGAAGHKQAAGRAGKRLRDSGKEVVDHKKSGRGKPPKIARLADLKICYNGLQ